MTPWRHWYFQERLLSSDRLDKGRDLTHEPPTWNLLKRVLSRWRWYACSLLVRESCLSTIRYGSWLRGTSQFAISGETECFGSNNLMGQWLKSIGGYTVEQIGKPIPDMFSYYDDSDRRSFRLLSIWDDCLRHRFYACLCYMDRLDQI